VDIINVSAGLNDSAYYHFDTASMPDGWRSYMSKAVKEKFGVLVMASGNIRDPKVAQRILKEGEADFLCIGRGLIAEPNWPVKVQTGSEHLLRNCISCNIGCYDNRVNKAKPIRCTVNPDIIYEDAYKERQVRHNIKVFVIGGGTAGLEAACTAAEVGCAVTLLEAKPYLGGLSSAIAQLPAKARLRGFLNYLIERAKNLLSLDIRLNSKSDLEVIQRIKPDIIFNATGAKPLLPPIAGLHETLNKKDTKVFTAFDLLTGQEEFKIRPDERVVVIGGGAVGLDIVEYFIHQGVKDVHIVELLPLLGKDLNLVTRQVMMEMVQKSVTVHTETKLVDVYDDHFILEKKGKETRLDFDYGFVCLGMRSERPLMTELDIYEKENDVEIVNIGDSKQPRKIIDGVREGHDILAVIEKVDLYKK